MKRMIAFVLLILGITAQAQKHIVKNPAKERVSFAVKAGWINSTLKGKDTDYLAVGGKIENRNNFFVGGGVNNPIGKRFALKHEFFFQNYGGQFTKNIEGKKINAKLKMSGIRINPISLTYRFRNFHLFVGPYVNILVSSSITAIDENGKTYQDHHIFGTETNDQQDSDFLQSMDYGVVAGAEYHFQFGGIIGVHYTRGFATIFDNSNVYENQGPGGADDLRIYNETFGVYLGYRI